MKLLDVNDCAPRFPASRSLFVSEDAARGGAGISLLAEDDDEGENGRLTYTLVHQSGPGQPFGVDQRYVVSNCNQDGRVGS